MAESDANNIPNDEREFALQRIYTKDVSFEAPGAPDIFSGEWTPEIKMDLQSNPRPIGDDIYEIVMVITLTCTVGDKTAYLCEVHQAGIFGIRGFDDEEMGHMLGAYCPNVLFPYAREVISDLVSKGSFPAMLVAPVNFDALYQQKLTESTADKAPNAH